MLSFHSLCGCGLPGRCRDLLVMFLKTSERWSNNQEEAGMIEKAQIQKQRQGDPLHCRSPGTATTGNSEHHSSTITQSRFKFGDTTILMFSHMRYSAVRFEVQGYIGMEKNTAFFFFLSI